MLELTLKSVSIIIVSGGNNPRILNQDFLSRNLGVVPSDYKTKDVIVTQPLSLVRYENGLAIQMEENKLSFAVSRPAELQWQEILPQIANRLLEVLPHVAYKAVGLNFALSSEAITGEAAEAELIDTLLAKGDWFDFSGGLTGSIVEFQFRNSRPQLNVKVAVEETITESGKSLSGPFMLANFHQEFTPEDTEERRAFINGLSSYEQQFREFGHLLPLFSNKTEQPHDHSNV